MTEHRGVECARWSLLILVLAKSVGLLLLTLLLFPKLNEYLGEWSYGRWVPVHLNWQLYGWCSLPLLGWLGRVFKVEAALGSRGERFIYVLWFSSLLFGGMAWLQGETSGKLFLDWMGWSRLQFFLSIGTIWCLFGISTWRQRAQENIFWKSSRVVFLALLLGVALALAWSTRTDVFPSINPDTSGATGSSLLGSTLLVILICLLLPYGLALEKRRRPLMLGVCWMAFILHCIYCASLDFGNVSHRDQGQQAALFSLWAWIPLLMFHWQSFAWQPWTKGWRVSLYVWWGVLVVSASLMFRPEWLDRFKFTHVLVAHSHLAMGIFASHLLIILLIHLMEETVAAAIFGHDWLFRFWQGAWVVFMGALVMAGLLEGTRPSFTMETSLGRTCNYSLQWFAGLVLCIVAWGWWRKTQDAFRTVP